MHVLIVHAHENSSSFSSALKDRAVTELEQAGHSVTVSDLYAMNFNPVGGRHDFSRLSGADHYKYQMEQLHACEHRTFEPGLQEEMEKLAAADVVNFNFPLWWFSVPAILKGWVDRVFAMGFAYGGKTGIYDEGAFPDKKAFVTVTTGGPAQFYEPGGPNGDINNILFNINHGIFYFTGMQVLPPFVVFGASRLSDGDRRQKLDEYAGWLTDIPDRKPLW